MATVLQAVIDSTLMAQVDLVAGDLGLSRSRCVRELVEWLVGDEDVQAQLRARLEERRRTKREETLARLAATPTSQARGPGRPARSQAPQAPWLADPEWIRATLMPAVVDKAHLAGMSHEQVLALAAKLPADVLAHAWRRAHPDAE